MDGNKINHPAKHIGYYGRWKKLKEINDLNEICVASPFSGTITEEEIYPTLPDGLNGALDGNRVKTYLKVR